MDAPIVFDAWLPLSFKKALGNRRAAGRAWRAPTWVGDHERRLQAYKVLQAYIDNAGREYLATEDEGRRANHREYGDAHLIVEQVVAALLGEEQQIVTEGAEDYDPEMDEDPLPANLPSTTLDDNEEGRPAWELQEWFREWADQERLPIKMQEAEGRAVGLGDGVYTLGWSGAKGRVRLRVWDPGFYYPVLDDGNEDDYPSKVHIAWEIPAETHGDQPTKIRRITWQLVDLPVGETRSFAWNDGPSTQTCTLTDATWTIDLARGETINDLTEGTAVFAVDEDGEVRDRDLGIDFLPVVHLPNTPSLLEHYGQSSLAYVLQILDDLSNADTDLQGASATTGMPPLALSGGALAQDKVGYKPGQVWSLGEKGSLSLVDTSRSLDALIKYIDHLLGRLSVNSRIPESVLGRIKPSEVPSGIALALSFGPLRAMIDKMRLVRHEKYPLLLKMVHRMSIAASATDVPTEYIRTEVEFGNYLPEDQQAAATLVKELLAANAISLETAVTMLMAVGLPIDDIVSEVVRIQEQDFEGAIQLLEATGDDEAVFAYLNREPPAIPNDAVQPPPTGPQAPTIVAPSVPNAPAQPVPDAAPPAP